MTTQDLINLVNAFDNGQTPEVPTQETAENVEAPVQETAEEEPAQAVEPEQATQETKDNAAFAQMRTQNKLLTDALTKFANAQGIQGTTDEILQALNEATINKQAQKQGIPAEYLKRMEALEAKAAQLDAINNQQRLANGFRTLQSKYNLDANTLQNFAAKLDASGVNLNTVDVVREYEAQNMDAIINAKVEALLNARTAEQAAKAAQVATTATAPIPNGVAVPNTSSSVSTTKDIIAFLRQSDADYDKRGRR